MGRYGAAWDGPGIAVPPRRAPAAAPRLVVVKEFAIYTAARLGLFVVAYGAVVGGYLLVGDETRIPLFWPFLVAVLVSAVASAFLLRRQRDAFALAVQRRAERASARFEAARAKEDDPEG